eukprot:scaffold4877_cov171-Ochromonas_danica.AAC.7
MVLLSLPQEDQKWGLVSSRFFVAADRYRIDIVSGRKRYDTRLKRLFRLQQGKYSKIAMIHHIFITLIF